ncbi:Uncharacterized protein APZ42_028418 [Daphnia magna]|uniref:Uncharacterized protein n=1 Tax=Daphnia magna TaxID=35525 RepID=A0A164QIP1_9CRUS|nr:Uncharacterized protein APZ42_028418 [Daphnia magna]
MNVLKVDFLPQDIICSPINKGYCKRLLKGMLKEVETRLRKSHSGSTRNL